MKRIRKFFNPASVTAGFTLVELLLASSLTSVVVGSSSFGLLTILRNNQKSNLYSEISYDVNRAVEFMSDEIKMAQTVESDADSAVTKIAGFTLPKGATPVLVLETPIGERVVNVVYYTQPVEQTWVGPNVIYRWGPSLDENGNYDMASLDDPTKWEAQVLIDAIDDAPKSKVCPTDWESTNDKPIQGFNACVKADKLVELNVAAAVDHHVLKKQDLSYQASTMVFPRAGRILVPDDLSSIDTTPPSDPPSDPPDDPLTPIVPPISDPPRLPFKCVNTECETGETSLTFEVLGGAITCGKGGDKIPVTTKLNLTYADGKVASTSLEANKPLSLATLPSGTKINLASIADGGSCKHLQQVKTNTPTPLVTVLKNGDPLPDIKPFDHQDRIAVFVQKYIKDGKINIQDNQVIYLFELGAIDLQNEAFDLQDNVVLATIKPPSNEGVTLTPQTPTQTCTRRC